MKRILFLPPEKWYVERHAEYIRRYLADEFFIEIATNPYPPYKNFLDRFPETSPFQRSPDDYDLIWPLLPSHWQIPIDEYKHKVVTVFYCPNEGFHNGVAAIGSATPMVDESLKRVGIPFHSLRFGIDLDIYKPFPMAREDNLLHVGYVGSHANPRHLMNDVVVPLADIPGIKLMIFPTTWINNGGHVEQFGGKALIDHIVTGELYTPGLVNMYNQMDVLIRTDHDPALSFPVLEAAACQKPFIATDSGIDKFFTDQGAGLLTPGDRAYYMTQMDDVQQKFREAIIWMRDHPEERIAMGKKGRQIMEENFTWDKCIPAWREFFRDGLRHAEGAL